MPLNFFVSHYFNMGFVEETMKFSMILYGLYRMLKRAAKKYPLFRDPLKEKNLTAQIKLMDDSDGRYFTFIGGKIISKRGIHASPDICMTFSSGAKAARLLMPPFNQLEQINAMKNFDL